MKPIISQADVFARSRHADLPTKLSRETEDTTARTQTSSRELASRLKFADAEVIRTSPVASFLDSIVIGRIDAAPVLTENQKNMQDLANDPTAFHYVMREIYGDNYDYDTAEAMRQGVLDGNFSDMPEMYFTDTGNADVFYIDEGNLFLVNEDILTEGIDAVLAPNEVQTRELACDHDAFHAVMQAIYGDNYDYDTAEAMRQEVLAGDFSNVPDMYFTDTGDADVFYVDEGNLFLVNEDFLNCDK